MVVYVFSLYDRCPVLEWTAFLTEFAINTVNLKNFSIRRTADITRCAGLRKKSQLDRQWISGRLSQVTKMPFPTFDKT